MAGFSTYQKPKGKAAPIYVPPGGAAAYAPQGTAGQTSPQPWAPAPVTPYQQQPAATPAVTPAAAAPAAAAPYTPLPAAKFDYQNAPVSDILGSDPFYQQLVGLNKATSGEEQAWMQSQIHRQQGYYGSEGDPVSVFGRIKESFDDALRTVTNNLASHGMIFSGEYGAQNNRARLGYERSKLDANMRLQDYVEGLRKGFADAQRARQQTELQAQLDAVTRWLGLHQPTPVPGQYPETTGEPPAAPAEPGYGGGGAGTTIPGYMPAQTAETQTAMQTLDQQILANAAAMPAYKPPKFKW